jgi:hypothetical protein
MMQIRLAFAGGLPAEGSPQKGKSTGPKERAYGRRRYPERNMGVRGPSETPVAASDTCEMAFARPEEKVARWRAEAFWPQSMHWLVAKGSLWYNAVC